MRAGILVMAIVMVCLSDRKVTRCPVEKNITVSELSKVSISCPSVMAISSDVKYLLLFNDSNISQIHLDQQFPGEGLFTGQFEVTAKNSGVYICKREVAYPPPFTKDCHTTVVMVAENQSLSAINQWQAPGANQSCPASSSFIPPVVAWVGCGVLLVYGLAVTCIAISLLRRLKKDEDDSNEYVNTRRGEIRKL